MSSDEGQRFIITPHNQIYGRLPLKEEDEETKLLKEAEDVLRKMEDYLPNEPMTNMEKARGVESAYFEEDAGTCSECGGPLQELGQLGSKTWYRCRNCGMDFSKGGPDAKKDEDSELKQKGDEAIHEAEEALLSLSSILSNLDKYIDEGAISYEDAGQLLDDAYKILGEGVWKGIGQPGITMREEEYEEAKDKIKDFLEHYPFGFIPRPTAEDIKEAKKSIALSKDKKEDEGYLKCPVCDWEAPTEEEFHTHVDTAHPEMQLAKVEEELLQEADETIGKLKEEEAADNYCSLHKKRMGWHSPTEVEEDLDQIARMSG